MRIALFHNLPSGGAKRTVYEQVSRLALKHEIDLYSLETANHDFADFRPFMHHIRLLPFQAGRLYASPLGRLNQGVRVLDLLRLRPVQKALAVEINRGNYDLALVHQCKFTFSPTILRSLEPPSLYYRHDPIRWLQDPKLARPYHRSNNFRSALDKVDLLNLSYQRLLKYEDGSSMLSASRVVTNSYFNREILYRLYGIAPSVCYHGVDLEKFRPLHLDTGNYVLSVGAISPYKGYDFIIQGLGCLPDNQRPRLVLVGNDSIPDERIYLQDLASSLKVEVEFRDLVDDNELVDLYNRALCMIYTPIMEPFGLVPIEAMACGKPVVGIREGGVRETVVDHQTGFLVNRDCSELAEAIQILCTNRARAKQYGEAGRQQAEKYWSWERAIDALERHIEEIV